MLKRWVTIFSTLIVLVFSFAACEGEAGKFDILIRNGKIVDGTGNPWFYGDIGVTGDTIVEIGDLTGEKAGKTIDARGLVVSPGFTDIHTHSDRGLGRTDSNANLNYLIQGVTTVVTGNCGGSVSLKVAETKKKWEKQGIGTNAVFQVGHGTIRRAVMGEELREATPEEIEKMKEILRQSMKEGAWGMSTGLEYIPGRFSSREEVIELVKVVAEFGGAYNSHQRDEVACVPEATKETVRIGKETGVRVNVSHLKVSGKKNWGMMKEVVKVFNDARASGIYITADMYPYEFAAPSTLISQLRIPEDMEPLEELRAKSRDRDLPDEERKKLREQYTDELLKALSDKLKREQIKKLSIVGVPHDWSFLRKGFPHHPAPFGTWGVDNYTILVSKKNSHLVGKNISDLAQEQKRDFFDIVVDLIIEEPDVFSSTNSMSEDEMKYAMKQDWLMFSSDGSASPIVKETDKPRYGHPRGYSSQARVLRKYVREDKVLTLENAIRKMTSLPASFLQMRDRGLLVRGYKADIAIFDPETIRDNATYADSRQYTSGTEYVIVNGKISIENGEYNGALNGKLLLLTENK